MAQPLAVVSQSTNQSNVGLLGVNKPDYLNTLVNRHGEQGADYLSFLRMFGFMIPTGQASYNHFEDDWWWQTFINQNLVPSPGVPGTSATYVLDPSSVNAAGNYFPQVNDVVAFPGNPYVEGTITAIAGTFPAPITLTIVPKNSTETLPAVAAGQELVISGNNQSEGADGATRKSIFDNVYTYTNTLDIIYTKYNVTGSQMANGPMWFNKDTNKTSFMAEYLMGLFRTDYRHSLSISMKLLTGRQNTNAVPDPFNPGFNLLGTQGLLQYMNQNANIIPYIAGTLSLATDDNISRILEREICGMYNLRFVGQNLDIEMENYLAAFLQPTQTSPAIVKQVAGALFEDNEDLTMSIGFNYFKKARYMHMIHPLRMLNHRQLLGAPNYNGQSLGLLISMDQKRVKMEGATTFAPSIGARYKEFNGYSRFAETIEVGGAGNGPKTNLSDTRSTFHRSEVGGHYTAGNKMIYMHI